MLIINNTSKVKTYKVGKKFYTFLAGQAREVNDDVLKECPEMKSIMDGSKKSKIIKKIRGESNVNKTKKRKS